MTGGDGGVWYRFYQGQKEKIGDPRDQEPKPIITNSQSLFHREFPDGKVLEDLDLQNHKLSVKDPATGQVKDHLSPTPGSGAHVMGLRRRPTAPSPAAPPSRSASSPTTRETDTWVNRRSSANGTPLPRWATASSSAPTRRPPAGVEPAREWKGTTQGKLEGNPLYLKGCSPPSAGPTPCSRTRTASSWSWAARRRYGYTGGGLLFWDRETKTPTIVEHTEIVPIRRP